MHSKQYTRLARLADAEGCDIVATHTLPGAMPHADGCYAVFARHANGTTRYAVTSWHIGMVSEAHWRSDPDDLQAEDLMCGDRHWTTHGRAMRDFAERVAMDSVDLDAV